MKKKILILTYYYKHKNAMASVRAIKLAKYFSKLGCDVTVLTSSQKDTWTKNYTEPVPDPDIKEIYAPQVKRWTLIQKYLDHRQKVGELRESDATGNAQNKTCEGKTAKIGIKQRFIGYLKWIFYFNLARQEDRCMFMGLKKAISDEKLSRFDAAIATYPTYGAFLTGIWLKKHGLCKQLIADFRDPLYNPGFRSKKRESEYDLKCLNKILKAADRVVCVSQGIADGIIAAADGFSKPITVITNGYDPDDITAADTDVGFCKEKIHFVYTGTLYHGKRCVDMLAKVLKELIAENKIAADGFVFDYAGPDFGELRLQLSEYGLQDTAKDYGFVSREQSIAMQKAADALLLLTWNEKDYLGVVPGKLFEYMAVKKVPVIALVTGNVQNSEVRQITEATGIGCACEEASPDGLENLKEFTVRLFNRESVCEAKVDKYSYNEICSEYLKQM